MLKSPTLKENLWSSLLPKKRTYGSVSSPRWEPMVQSPSKQEKLHRVQSPPREENLRCCVFYQEDNLQSNLLPTKRIYSPVSSQRRDGRMAATWLSEIPQWSLPSKWVGTCLGLFVRRSGECWWKLSAKWPPVLPMSLILHHLQIMVEMALWLVQENCSYQHFHFYFQHHHVHNDDIANELLVGTRWVVASTYSGWGNLTLWIRFFFLFFF